MPITAEAFIRIDGGQAVDELGRINTAIRQFSSTAELAGRKQLVGLADFAKPLQQVRLDRPANQVAALTAQLDHLSATSKKVAATMEADQTKVRGQYLLNKITLEDQNKALARSAEQAAASQAKLTAQIEALQNRIAAGRYTDVFVPLEEGRGTLTAFDELTTKQKMVIGESERARASISGLGAEILRMGERGSISASGIQQLVTRLELLKTQGVAGTAEFAAVNPALAAKEVSAIDDLSESLVHLQDDLKRASTEVQGTEQELQGMPKQTAEVTRGLMHASSAAQGMLLGVSVLEGNLTSAAFAFVFMRFAILKTLAITAAFTAVVLGLVKALTSFVGLMKSAAAAVREFGKEAHQIANYLRSAALAQEIETFSDRLARGFGVAREDARSLGFELAKLDRTFAQMGVTTDFFNPGTGQVFADFAAATGEEAGELAKQFGELFSTTYDDAKQAQDAFKEFGREFDVNVNSTMDSVQVLEALQKRFAGSAAASAGQLDGYMARLGATFQTVRIQIGKLLETGLKPVIDVLMAFGQGIIAGFEGAILAGRETGKLDSQIKDFSQTIRAMMPLLNSLGVTLGQVLYWAMGRVAQISKVMIDAFLRFWSATKGLRDTAGRIAQSFKEITGSLSGALILYTMLKKIGPDEIKLPKVTFPKLTVPKFNLATLRKSLTEVNETIWRLLGASSADAVAGMQRASRGIIVGLLAALRGFLPMLLKGLWAIFRLGLVGAFKSIKFSALLGPTLVRGLISAFRGAITGASLGGLLRGGIRGIKILTIAGALGVVLELALKAIGPTIAEKFGIDLTSGIAGGIWNNMFSIEAALAGGIGAVIGQILIPIPGVGAAVGLLLGTALGTALAHFREPIKEKILALFEGFQVFIAYFKERWMPLIQVLFKILVQFIGESVGSVVTFIRVMGEAFIDLGKLLWEWAGSVWKNVLSPLFTSIRDKFGDPIIKVMGVVVQAIVGLFDKLREVGKTVIQWLVDRWNWLADNMPGLDRIEIGTNLEDGGNKAGESWVTGFLKRIGEISKATFNLPLNPFATTKRFTDAIRDHGTELKDALKILFHGDPTVRLREQLADVRQQMRDVEAQGLMGEMPGLRAREASLLQQIQQAANQATALSSLWAEAELRSIGAQLPAAGEPQAPPTFNLNFDMRGSILDGEDQVRNIADRVTAEVERMLSSQHALLGGVVTT